LGTAFQERNLPCDVTTFALAADDSGTWFECSNVVYWLGSKSAEPLRIASSEYGIDTLPAPRGSEALLSIALKSRPNRVALMNRDQLLKSLPNSPVVMAWSADAKKIYIESGPSKSDAVPSVAVYDLASGSSISRKLVVPTETLRTCASSGHVYTTTPKYPGFGGSTFEYTADLKPLNAIRGWNGARLSATCSYVASESDFHGPLAWSIYETATGKVLHKFAEMNDETGEFYSVIEWNPRIDSLLLRKHYSGGATVDEVYDVEENRVVRSFKGAVAITWSPNGESVVFGSGKRLVRQSIPHRD
jgi:hypothetical protein